MLYVISYVSAMALANILVSVFGPVISPVNAFLLIGLDMAIRDKLHDKWIGNSIFLRMLVMISFAGAVSYAANPSSGTVAVASVVSFLASNAIDSITYHLMRKKSYMTRANGSNIFGAAVDSFAFPVIAFGAFIPAVVIAQFAAKVLGGALWSFVVRRLHRCSRAAHGG